MDRNIKVTALLTRIRGYPDFHASDEFSAWGYQGNCSFNNDALKHLADIEGKGVWFNKLDPNEPSKTPHAWGDYLDGSAKFMRGELGNPPTTDKQHVHLSDIPRTYWAIADECFKRKIFKSDEAKACFNMYNPPSKGKKQKKQGLLPAANQSPPQGPAAGHPTPPSVNPQFKPPAPVGQQPPPPAQVASSPASKPLKERVKERLEKNKSKNQAAKEYKKMIECSPPIIPGSKVLFKQPMDVLSPDAQTAVLPPSTTSSSPSDCPPQNLTVAVAVSSSGSPWFPNSLLSSTSPTIVSGSKPSHCSLSGPNSGSPASLSSSKAGTSLKPVVNSKLGEKLPPSPPVSASALSLQPIASPTSLHPAPGLATLPLSKPGLSSSTSSPSTLAPATLKPSLPPNISLSSSSGSHGMQSVGRQESAGNPTQEVKKSSPSTGEDAEYLALEQEINREMDVSYGPVNVETNRRDYAYPPVFDKMTKLVSSWKKTAGETKELNVKMHREMEMMTARNNSLDENLALRISKKVEIVFKKELEAKTTLLSKQIDLMGRGIRTEMSEKLHNSIDGLRTEVTEAFDEVVGDAPAEAPLLPFPQASEPPLESDLRSVLNSKRPRSPSQSLPLPKATRTDSVLMGPPVPEVAPLPPAHIAPAVTVARSSLFSGSPSPAAPPSRQYLPSEPQAQVL